MANDKTGLKIYVGDRFIDENAPDDRNDFRIIKIKNGSRPSPDSIPDIADATFRVKMNDGTIMTMTKKEIIARDYKKLRPDGIMCFNVVISKAQNPDGTLVDVKDSMITMFRQDDLDKGDNKPYAVARQNMIDLFSMQIVRNPNVLYMGICMNRENCPEGVDFDTTLACESIESSDYVEFYLDDTMEEIVAMANTKKIDVVMNQSYIHRRPGVFGLYPNAYSFLIGNDFYFDLCFGFDILKLPLELDKYLDEDGHIDNLEKLGVLEQALCKELLDYVIAPFTKEDDLDALNHACEVQGREFTLLSDNNCKIYILVYDKNSKYKNDGYANAFDASRELRTMIKSSTELIDMSKYELVLKKNS